MASPLVDGKNVEMAKRFFSLMLRAPETRDALADVLELVANAPERIIQLAEHLRGDATLPPIHPEEMEKAGRLFKAVEAEIETPELTKMLMKTLKDVVFG